MGTKYWKNYKGTQYDDYNNQGLFLYNSQVDARYIEQDEPTFKGNLLIEALPPVLNFEQLFERVREFPIYADSECDYSKEYRLGAIGRLEKYVLPLSQYQEIHNKISIVMRNGYVGKKIMEPKFIKDLNNSSKLVKSTNKELEEYQEAKCMIRNDLGAQYGFSVFGISGAGKTTALNKILCIYPQCIVHTGTDDNRYLFKQVPWIKIDCSHNGTVKGLCQNFFSKMDEVLGTNYLKQYGGRGFSINRMLVSMTHVAQKHALGVLVIDEIQHLANSKGKAGNALDFFVTLMNEIKIPIINIGTYKAVQHVLAKEFTQARRSSGLGEVEFIHIEQGSEGEWDYFIEHLWNYQWTKEKVDITDEFKHVMYEETMGIPDRVVKLFMASQIRAILDEKERLTTDLIKKVAQKHSVENLYENKKYTLEQKEKIKRIRKEQKEKKFKKKRDLINNIVFYFSQLGYEYKFLYKIAENTVNRYGADEDIESLKRKVAEVIFHKNN
ncbi:AAA family ATPase [Brassicibacter mesophilus]|uniref:AAA family ATPase n=1 Tax=Brassicibacter mesophilus TaxID=745119 RepID=UPI003D1F729A